MYKVTIIVTVYNNIRFIKRCIDSILNQDYKNLELIVVDDCSTDGSFQYLNSLQIDKIGVERFIEVKIIRNVINYGSAKTRNLGLNLATGDYVTFVDGDDWIEDDAITKMMEDIVYPDIIMSDFLIDRENSGSEIKRQGDAHWSKTTIIKKMLTGDIHGSVCNRIYKKSLIDLWKIRFVDHADYAEDLAFNIKVILHCDDISYKNIAYYHYCINHQSMTQYIKSDIDRQNKLNQKIENIKSVSNYFDEMQVCLIFKKELNYCKIETKMPILHYVNSTTCGLWRSLFSESNSQILRHKDYPLSFRFELLLLAYVSPSLFIILHKIKLKLNNILRS